MLPVVPLVGDPRTQGRTHGEALRADIHANIALYADRMRADAGLSDADIDERSRTYLDVFTRLDPAYRATMDGIAEASAAPIEQIAMLNARYELLYTAWSALGTVRTECTSFGLTPAATADGHLRIGQNWDWFPEVRGALLDITSDDGPRVLAFTEAGIAGPKIGLNSAGLGLVVNGLGSDADEWTVGGVPFHLRTWRVLRSRDLDEAVARATDGPLACSANFLIAQGGRVVDVETSPRGSVRLEPDESGLLVHANHFTQPDRLGIRQPWRTWPPSTFHRARRLAELLSGGGHTPERIGAALRDHDGRPDSVCRHPDPALPRERRAHTAFSALIDLADGVLGYTVGPPCAGDHRHVALSA